MYMLPKRIQQQPLPKTLYPKAKERFISQGDDVMGHEDGPHGQHVPQYHAQVEQEIPDRWVQDDARRVAKKHKKRKTKKKTRLQTASVSRVARVIGVGGRGKKPSRSRVTRGQRPRRKQVKKTYPDATPAFVSRSPHRRIPQQRSRPSVQGTKGRSWTRAMTDDQSPNCLQAALPTAARTV